ncbi:hypothetical protein BS47DRAFT_1336090 [Hydnum rufescens UP504]|uniref:F-box domain-containing protein n=1 Tax=Hydnum rufescens UP504 TaxID=1448309 RepID=A0A9P6BBI8_9AGAM|nr:hypothetical protein BS47DRAFT_1336090 [Hydnum rufescens UP504]
MVPLSFPIPYDVLCVIIEHVEFETLKEIGLVSRDLHHEVSKRLWRTISIQTYDLEGPHNLWTHLRTAASIISRENRAQHLRDLCLGLEGSLGTRKEAEVVIRELFSSLRLATNLSSIRLDVFRRTPCKLVLDSFGIYGVAPRLDHIILSEPMGRAIMKDHNFWRSRPTIKSLKWDHYARGFHLSPKSPPLPLPFLETVQLGRVEHSSILRACPVTNLTVAIMENGECGILLENIRSSTADLLHLRVHICQTPDIFPSVIGHLPRLQSLAINHPSNELDDAELLDVLTSLSDLVLLELSGDRDPRFFERFLACAHRFKSLQRVDVRGRFPETSHTYGRDDAGCWIIKPPQFLVF